MSAYLDLHVDDSDIRYVCGPVVAIGRGPHNDVVIEHKKVSRHHALIRLMEGNKYFLVDMGSSNGTYVNGNRVMIPVELKDSDSITVGEPKLLFHSDVQKDGPTISPAFEDGLKSTVLTIGGVVKHITILVTDIRNYTGLTASLNPDLLASIIGRLFRDTTRIVEKNHGSIDKFMGDAVMAIWPSKSSDTGRAVMLALRSAYEIWRTVEDINVRHPGLPQPLRIGVGINSGEAMQGNIGAEHRRDYTVIGECVNTAFRLEKATKEMNTNIIVGPGSYAHLPREILQGRIHSIRLPGTADPMDVLGLKFEELDRIQGLQLTAGKTPSRRPSNV